MKSDFFYNWHKTTLEKHTTEVDVDAIWAAIEPEVDVINAERKKRRGFPLFLFGLFFFVLGAGFMGVFGPSLMPKSAPITNTDHTKNTLTSKEGTQIDVINEVAYNSTNTIKTSETKTTKGSLSKTNSSTLFSSSKKVSDAIIHEKTRDNSTPNTTSEIRLINQTPFTPTGDNRTSSQISLNNSSSTLISSSLIDEDEIKDQERLLAMEAIPYIGDISPIGFIEKEDLPSKPISLRQEPKFRFALGVYSGVAFVNRSLRAKGNDDTELLQLREATENSLELLNNGLQFRTHHKSGFYGSIGFQYARIAERFQYIENVLKEDSIANQLIGFSNNLLGDRNAIFGSAPDNTEFNLEFDFYNNYHLLEIPISLGYQKRLSAWSLGVRGSYIQNISLRTKGRILDSPFEVINLESGNEIFKNTLDASFELTAQAGYRLSPNIELGMDIFYRHLPGSITTSQYALDQSYNWIGMNASLSYLF